MIAKIIYAYSIKNLHRAKSLRLVMPYRPDISNFIVIYPVQGRGGAAAQRRSGAVARAAAQWRVRRRSAAGCGAVLRAAAGLGVEGGLD
jgi:hypothetical protein